MKVTLESLLGNSDEAEKSMSCTTAAIPEDVDDRLSSSLPDYVLARCAESLHGLKLVTSTAPAFLTPLRALWGD